LAGALGLGHGASNVDAAIAQLSDGMIDTTGHI
jgi:hypothetical protein